MRKSISVAFFSLVSTLMVLGIVLMGASEWVLFKNYFAKDRYETLDQVVGGHPAHGPVSGPTGGAAERR